MYKIMQKGYSNVYFASREGLNDDESPGHSEGNNNAELNSYTGTIWYYFLTDYLDTKKGL